MENNTNTNDLALGSNTSILLSLEPQEWFDIKLEQGCQGSSYLYHSKLLTIIFVRYLVRLLKF